MVLLARSVQRTLRPVSASARALSTSSSAFTSRASTTCRAGLASRPALAPKSSAPISLPSRNPFGAPASIRSLTGQREKVKVLLVLYDGGKHAEEVRFILLERGRERENQFKCRDLASEGGFTRDSSDPNIIRRLSSWSSGFWRTHSHAKSQLEALASRWSHEGQEWLGFPVAMPPPDPLHMI